MVTSATYCQSAPRGPPRSGSSSGRCYRSREQVALARPAPPVGRGSDPRRGALLCRRSQHAHAWCQLPAGAAPRISNYAWKPDPEPVNRMRRSIYVLAKRNMRYPLFDAFDLPDMHNSCARRTQTTTAPQAPHAQWRVCPGVRSKLEREVRAIVSGRYQVESGPGLPLRLGTAGEPGGNPTRHDIPTSTGCDSGRFLPRAIQYERVPVRGLKDSPMSQAPRPSSLAIHREIPRSRRDFLRVPAAVSACSRSSLIGRERPGAIPIRQFFARSIRLISRRGREASFGVFSMVVQVISTYSIQSLLCGNWQANPCPHRTSDR